MNIPDEAVEAAAKYVWEKSVPNIPWSLATKRAREIYLQDARWTLEAAAPHLMARALNEAADDYRHYETPNAQLYLRDRAADILDGHV